MSVLKSKRKPSQFEVFHQLTKLRKDITDLLLRDFGFDTVKAEKRLEKRFGKPFEELDEKQQATYARQKRRWDAFDEWFIEDERKTIVNCLRAITREVYIANSIYPTVQEELTERRLHQDRAIGLCHTLTLGEMIQTEVNLIKGHYKIMSKLQRQNLDTLFNQLKEVLENVQNHSE